MTTVVRPSDTLLERARASLRLLEPAHYEVISGWLHDSDTRLFWRTAGQVLQPMALAELLGQSRLSFVVIEPSSGVLLSLLEALHLDHSTGRIEISVVSSPSHHSDPLIGAAAWEFIGHCFRTFPVRFVTAATIEGHGFAAHALGRVGFVHEGTFREAAFIDGRWRDVRISALTRESWELVSGCKPEPASAHSVRAALQSWASDAGVSSHDELDSLGAMEVLQIIAEVSGRELDEVLTLKDWPPRPSVAEITTWAEGVLPK